MAKYLGIPHSADNDGHACYAIMKLKFGDDIDVMPYNYSQDVTPYLDAAKDKVVIMADVTFSWEDTLRLAEVAKALIICDHHEKVWKDFNSNKTHANHFLPSFAFEFGQNRFFEFYFDNNKSGCEVLWNYLFPDKDLPYALKLIGAYDTGKEGIFTPEPTELGKDAIAFGFGLRLTEHGKTWAAIYNCIDTDSGHDVNFFCSLLEDGRLVYRFNQEQNKRVEATCTTIRPWRTSVSVKGSDEGGYCGTVNQEKDYTIALSNTTQDPSMFFPQGEYDFSVTYYKTKKGDWKYSLRPGLNQENCPNLADIAAQFGGGGYAKAAGFIINKNLFE